MRGAVVDTALSCFVVGFEEAQTLRGRWRARGLGPEGRPPFAMRMTRDGIELGATGDGTPLMVPWAAFDGFRLCSTLGRPVLEPVLGPGAAVLPVGRSSVGRSSVGRFSVGRFSVGRFSVGRFSVTLLDQPLDAIDYGLRYFSAGRAGVVRV